MWSGLQVLPQLFRRRVDKSRFEYRVRIFAHDNTPVTVPDDQESAEQFGSAQAFFDDMLSRQADRIELALTTTSAQLVYFLNGVPTQRNGLLSVEAGYRVLNFVKQLAGLNLTELRKPQSGNIRVASLGSTNEAGWLNVRVSGSTRGQGLGSRAHSTHCIGTQVSRYEYTAARLFTI